MADLTLLKNANILAPKPLGLGHVLVGGGKILGLFAAGDLPQLAPENVIDVEGRFLLPGIIDTHAHITGGGGEAGFATQVPPVPLSHFTANGVTTVVGLLGTDDTSRSTENLVARAYGLREEGMSAFCWTGGYHLPLTTLTGSAKKDIVFIDPIIGIGEFAISDHRSSQPTFEEVIRLASEAHVAGLMTGKAGIIHFHLGDGHRKLDLIERALGETELPARVLNPTHVNRNKDLFEHACQLSAKGIYLDITAFPLGTAAPGWDSYQAIESAIEKGLPLNQVTVSSDGGGCLPSFDEQGCITHMDFGKPETLLETLQKVVSDGVSLEVALPMFTQNPAELCRFHTKGRIQEGMDADILIADDDLNLHHVMCNGRWHLHNQQQVIKGTFE